MRLFWGALDRVGTMAAQPRERKARRQDRAEKSGLVDLNPDPTLGGRKKGECLTPYDALQASFCKGPVAMTLA